MIEFLDDHVFRHRWRWLCDRAWARQLAREPLEIIDRSDLEVLRQRANAISRRMDDGR
jgi:hypothetical protein